MWRRMYPALLLGRDGDVLFPFPKLKRCRNAHALHTVSGPHLACGLSQRHASYDTGREKQPKSMNSSQTAVAVCRWRS